MARYIHDTLLQTLVVLSFRTGGGSASGLESLVQQACNQTRLLSVLIAPPDSGGGDAEAAIGSMASLAQEAGLSLTLEFQPLSSLVSTQVAEILFVLVQDVIRRAAFLKTVEPLQIRVKEAFGRILLELSGVMTLDELAGFSPAACAQIHLWGGKVEWKAEAASVLISLPV